MSEKVLPQFALFADVPSRFDDIADLLDADPSHDPRPFLRASARRYRAYLAGLDADGYAKELLGLSPPNHRSQSI